MIQKWDLTAAPFDKDPERHKVRLHASKEDLERLLSAIPIPCSEPFVTLAKDFNWFFYLPSLSPDRKDQVLDLLKNFDRRHAIHGENIAPTPLTYVTPFPPPPTAPAVFAAPPPAGPKPQPAVTEVMGTGIMAEAEDSVIETEVQSHVTEGLPADLAPVAAPAAEPEPAPPVVPVVVPVVVPDPVPAPVEEKDSGLAEITLVEYVGFYPAPAAALFEKIMPQLEEQIIKFKLKIRLSEAARIPYEYRPDMEMAFLKDGCASKRCYRALFLGPELDAEGEGKFFKAVQAAASEAHITLHRLGAAGSRRESELMNCALEMTIPAARLTASQSPHKRF